MRADGGGAGQARGRAWGRRVSERFPDGEVVGQGHDAAGRVANVWFGSMGSFATTYAYDAEGRLEEVSNSHGRSVEYAYYGGAAGMASHRLHELTTGGGAVTEFDYDAAGRLGRYRVVPTSGGAHNAAYDYRDDGTIAAIYAGWSVVPASFTGFAWDYAYDAAGRLTRERRAEYDDGSIVATALDQNYTYDAAGNRLSRTGSGTGHEAMGPVGGHDMHNDMHQLEHFALGALSHVRRAYDDAGNTTRHWDTAGSPAFDWNYTWSADNRLTYAQNAVTGGKKVRYVYDWQGRRLQRTNETHAQAHLRTRYYFHGLTPLAERASDRQYDDFMGWGYWTWSTSRQNTLAPGQYGHVLVQRNWGTDRYLHYDHVGNVIAESSTAGVFTAQHEQDAFGRPVLSSAAGGWSHNALHMTTKDYDADAGMFYFYQRWYQPGVGLFGSAAPMPRDAEHPYTHGAQNPVQSTDPSGEYCGRPPHGIVCSGVLGVLQVAGPIAGAGSGGGTGSGPPTSPPPNYSEPCGSGVLGATLPSFPELKSAVKTLTQNAPPYLTQCLIERLSHSKIGCDDDTSDCQDLSGGDKRTLAHAHTRKNPDPGVWVDGVVGGVIANPKHRGTSINLCPSNIVATGCNTRSTLIRILIHEAAHNCGMPPEGDWGGPAAPGPWGGSGVPGTTNGGDACK